MKQNEISRRYVRAVFELVTDAKQRETILNELRVLAKCFADKEITEFITSPMVSPDKKLECIRKPLEGKGLNENTENLVLLLAQKNRLGLFEDLVKSYQDELDKANGVVRGVAKSSANLDQAECKQIEKKISEYLKKNVILDFAMDPKLVGGIVATVGSHTFDDSLSSYLRRLKENLNRSTI
jgi:F-type H+-transporting ATPase subunit delta